VARRNPGFSGLGYQLFLGGSLARTGKLALLAHYGIPAELVFEVIQATLVRYFQEKQAGESFTDYVHRLETENWEDFIEEKLASLAEKALQEKLALKPAV
jgi:sulfite reductase beta subunit-like hemoprotein